MMAGIVKSMTGYGRGEILSSGYPEQFCIVAEIKTVNSRYREISLSCPKEYRFYEHIIFPVIQSKVDRGKVDVQLSITPTCTDVGKSLSESNVLINEGLAIKYLEALRLLNRRLGLEDDIRLSHFLQFDDIFIRSSVHTESQQVNPSQLLEDDVKRAVLCALERLDAMRLTEGQKLVGDMSQKLELLRYYVEQLALQSEDIMEAYKARITVKLKELLESAGVTPDYDRLMTEAGLLSERMAVDEELVRLGSHLEQFLEVLSGGGNVGRKLDFLLQEINREVNTIGSKIQGQILTGYVVESKSLLEKLREQAQNLE